MTAKRVAKDFPVVCVGGSAGGLDAYTRLLRHLPADNLARRARFTLFCRKEVAALPDAISRHCAASRDVLEGNMRSTRAQADRLAGMHEGASGKTKAVITDWLDRIDHIQSYRKLVANRLHRAVSDPTALDQRDGDAFGAAQESLLICARAGVHPANIADASKELVAASERLQRKMSVALI
jgi:hypothetical protein